MQSSQKIGILTFHASHNFGSMFQNFALQHVLQQLGYDCETINFRSQFQRQYRSGDWHIPTNTFNAFVKKLLLFPWHKDAIKKYNKFEQFLQKDLNCSAQYNTEEEVLKHLNYDIYLAGGDQIWNTEAGDFSWIYFLPFKASKKISYAPSLGDHPTLTKEEKTKIKQYLKSFTAISVREESGATLLGNFTQKPVVVLDPTLLLTSDEWSKHITKEPLVRGDYLFVYAPYRRPTLLRSIPSNNRLPLVLSTPLDWLSLYNPRFIKCLNTGPWDFLNLIYYSKGVVSGSFHAAVFAKLFNKPLYCMDMGPGSRIANLEEKFKHIEEERAKSMQFLKEALK